MNIEEIPVNLLKTFNESTNKLLSINKKIKLQIEELSKTKSLMDECQNCLNMQNEMLNKLKLEQEKVFEQNFLAENNNSTSSNIVGKTIQTEIHKNSNIDFKEILKSGGRKKIIIEKGQMNEIENVNKDEPIRENEIDNTNESSINLVRNVDNDRSPENGISSHSALPSCQIRIYSADAYVCDNLLQYALNNFRKNPECQKSEFPTQTQLPSKMKFMDGSKRATIITVINKKLRHTIKEIFGEFSTHSSNEIRLTALDNSVWIRVYGFQDVIRLVKYKSLRLTDFSKEEENITFFIDSIPSVLLLEVIQNESSLLTPIPVIPEFSYPETIYDLQEQKSFLRNKLSLEECRRNIRFIAAGLVFTRSSTTTTTTANSVVSLSVMDYSGKLLMNLKITPRNPIKHMRETKLSQNDILGQIDEHDCVFISREALYKRIIIGFNVYDTLQALRVPVETVLGIRDLAMALCLTEENTHQLGKKITLPSLMKGFLPNFTAPRPTDIPSEVVVHKIRALYLRFENQWTDHLVPQSVLKSTNPKPIDKEVEEPVLEKEFTSGWENSNNCTLEQRQDVPFNVINQKCSQLNQKEVEPTSFTEEESKAIIKNKGDRVARLNLEFGEKTDDALDEMNSNIDTGGWRIRKHGVTIPDVIQNSIKYQNTDYHLTACIYAHPYLPRTMTIEYDNPSVVCPSQKKSKTGENSHQEERNPTDINMQCL